MDYISVIEFTKKYGISERTARNYCAGGKIDGAFLTGKTWNIPADAELPKRKSLDDILDFHVRFERIHPFQDGNGRVGRLIMFKECLANAIVPFIITDDLKMFYYRGLHEWGHVRSSSARLLLEGRKNDYLTDTCLTAQDQYKEILKHLGIVF